MYYQDITRLLPGYCRADLSLLQASQHALFYTTVVTWQHVHTAQMCNTLFCCTACLTLVKSSVANLFAVNNILAVEI